MTAFCVRKECEIGEAGPLKEWSPLSLAEYGTYGQHLVVEEAMLRRGFITRLFLDLFKATRTHVILCFLYNSIHVLPISNFYFVGVMPPDY